MAGANFHPAILAKEAREQHQGRGETPTEGTQLCGRINSFQETYLVFPQRDHETTLV